MLNLTLGMNLWEEANYYIPGGTMLLSKNKNLFSPEYWPCYYKKAKGYVVEDLDGNQFIDFASNGIGACTLGFANTEVDEHVIKTVQNGVMSSLNCPADVSLAKRLVDLHPWSDMVRFARSGGEANAISIRIARAASGRDKVAICGYHGWHDWYLSANIADKDQLGEHLLEGLGSKGVPSILKDTVIPIRYNNFDDLEKIKENDDIGVLKMEPTRTFKPATGYLESIREICDNKGIILIFDECTSGFREANGGVHLNLPVAPDMCILGKALGNGYAITAVLGRRDIMEHAIDTFISSTFWTEAIGPNAALKTLEIIDREKTWLTLPNLGKQVKDIWLRYGANYQIELVVSGLDALPVFRFTGDNSSILKTAFTEMMLDRRILATTQFYPSIAHDSNSINLYESAVKDVFSTISQHINQSLPVHELCIGKICNTSFKRLN